MVTQDVFDRIFHITRGGMSKASQGISLSEDIFAGLWSIMAIHSGCYGHLDDCVLGQKEVRCGFPADVLFSEIRYVCLHHCYSGLDDCFDGSHSRRYLCKLKYGQWCKDDHSQHEKTRWYKKATK